MAQLFSVIVLHYLRGTLALVLLTVISIIIITIKTIQNRTNAIIGTVIDTIIGTIIGTVILRL